MAQFVANRCHTPFGVVERFTTWGRAPGGRRYLVWRDLHRLVVVYWVTPRGFYPYG
jgi:hypothetical protein